MCAAKREDSREFENLFKDFNPKLHKDTIITMFGEVPDLWQQKLNCNIKQMLIELESLYNEKTADWTDFTCYTGTTGVAMLYLLMSERCIDRTKEQYLKRGLALMGRSLQILKGQKYSFLGGDPGPLAVGAVIHHKLGNVREAQILLNRLVGLHTKVLPVDADLSDEVLYGRAGYLYALLFVNRHFGNETIKSEIIANVAFSIINSGRLNSQKLKSRSPLMYEWMNTKYLGAAHGLAGILYMLLQASQFIPPEDLEKVVRPSIDFLVSQRYTTGNFPSSLTRSADLLVQWCHGAPGIIHLLVLAKKVFQDKKYVLEAKTCADVTWRRGLLRKGCGLCHGVAGNAYSFLVLYQHTGDLKYLHRAHVFAEWCFDCKKRQCRTPDHPYSLYEGLAGTIYFLIDMLEPKRSAFPGFQLPVFEKEEEERTEKQFR